jgi:xylulokinase
MDYLLGIDAGTTSFKAVLFDLNGNELVSAIYEYELNYPGADRVELEAEQYWHACQAVIRQVLLRWKGKVSDIRALAIASQGETLIALDRQGKPLRPAIVWLDNRAREEAQTIKAEFGAEPAFKITGQPDIVPTWPAAKVLWLRHHEPRVFQQVSRFLLLEDYLIYKLTSQFVAEGSLLSSSLYFNIHDGQWWSEMLDFIGISPELLPAIRGSGQVIGELTDAAAHETGLAKETLVVTGALDQAASAIGAGNIGQKMITETTGSVLALCANIPQPTFDPRQRIPCHYHAIPGSYFLLPWCQTAGMVYKWFRNEFYLPHHSSHTVDASALFQQMDREAGQVAPGSDGVIMLPHLAGAFTPESNPSARGVFFGLSLSTGRGHLARAILEAVAFMLKRNINLLEELGTSVQEIRSLGGGSKSGLWNQIKADVCQKPVVTVRSSETTSLGAAMLAAVALRLFDSLEQAAEKMCQPGQHFQPNPANEAVYSAAYEKYIRLYEALEPIF